MVNRSVVEQVSMLFIFPFWCHGEIKPGATSLEFSPEGQMPAWPEQSALQLQFKATSRGIKLHSNAGVLSTRVCVCVCVKATVTVVHVLISLHTKGNH